MKQERVAVDLGDETHSPQRWRSPLTPGRPKCRAPVGQSFTHVVQEQVGERMNRLMTKFRQMRTRSGFERRNMAGVAPRRHEHLAPTDGPRVVSSRGRHRKTSRVEHDGLERFVAYLWTTTRRLRHRDALGGRVILVREQRRRDADVPDKRRGRLLQYRGLFGFPAEAAKIRPAGRVVPDDVWPAGNPVVVGIVWISELSQRGFGDRLEETHT